MSRFEQGFESGATRPNTFPYDLYHSPLFQAGSTLTTDGGVSHSLPDSGQLSAVDTVEKLESVFLYGGQDGGLLRTGAVVDHQLFDSHSCFHTIDDPLRDFNYSLRMETEQHRPAPMPATSFDSGTVSDTTYASCHTLSSLAEYGDDESAEDLNNVQYEGNSPWPPNLHLRDPYHSYSMNVAASHESAEIVHDVHGTSFHVEATDNHPDEVDALLPAVSRSAKTLSNYVRLVCACNRFKRGRRGKRKSRSAEESNKHSCEIRISKKIPRDGKYKREKAWIGTFATPAQRGRALDVGKYFLCTKRKKAFSDPKSEATLAAFKDHLQGLPLTELVEKVTKLAKYFGETGLLPQNLHDL